MFTLKETSLIWKNLMHFHDSQLIHELATLLSAIVLGKSFKWR